MEEFLKKGIIMNLISTVLFFAIGIIIIVESLVTLRFITFLVEMTLIICGIITIINYIRVESKHDVFSLGFVQGVVCILLALFLVANPNVLITILPVCIGIWMVFGSLAKIQVAIKLNSWGQRASGVYIFLSVLMFAIGLVIVCNPFRVATLIIQTLGLGLITFCLFDIMQIIGILRFLNKIEK